MARWWKEQYDSENFRHGNEMWGAGWPYEGIPHTVETTPAPKLIPVWIYFVSACSFTFIFRSLDQIRACLKFYSQKVLESSRIDIGGADHWEVQSWYQRLPLYLRKETKRQKVIKALTQALAEFSK